MSESAISHGAMPPFRGDLGRYRLVARLAQGGMGDVYLAMTQGPGNFHKLAVVKELRSSFSDEGAALRMFLDEARLAARLHHPNVVQTNEEIVQRCLLERMDERSVVEERSILDGLADAREFLVHEAAGPDMHVPDFGVPHLLYGEPDVGA